MRIAIMHADPLRSAAKALSDMLDRQGHTEAIAKPIRRALADCAAPSGPKSKRWPKRHAWRP